MRHDVRVPGRAGFTLLELLVVLVILGVVSALTMPLLGPRLEGARLQAAAASLVTLAGSGRYLSVASGYNHELVLSLETRRVLLRRSDTKAVVMARHLDKGVAIDWIRVRGNVHKEGGTTMVFHPDGTATDASMTLRHRQRTLLLTLDPASGRLREGSLGT